MFTRNLLLLIILSSCSIASIDTSNLDFDASFSNSDKFQFNKCLSNINAKVDLSELKFNYFSENINSLGLEFNTRYTLKLIIKTQNSDYFNKSNGKILVNAFFEPSNPSNTLLYYSKTMVLT